MGFGDACPGGYSPLVAREDEGWRRLAVEMQRNQPQEPAKPTILGTEGEEKQGV